MVRLLSDESQKCFKKIEFYIKVGAIKAQQGPIVHVQPPGQGSIRPACTDTKNSKDFPCRRSEFVDNVDDIVIFGPLTEDDVIKVSELSQDEPQVNTLGKITVRIHASYKGQQYSKSPMQACLQVICLLFT